MSTEKTPEDLFVFCGKTKRSYGRVDGTEVGHHSRIPLWMFGLLY